MKALLDMPVSASLLSVLEAHGHEGVHAHHLGLDRAPDEDLRDAVTTVSSAAGYRSRIAHMQQGAREAGGYLRAADAIQRFGHRQSREEEAKTQEPKP